MNSKLKNLFLSKLSCELPAHFDQSFFSKLSLERSKELLFTKWYTFIVSSCATLCVFFFALSPSSFPQKVVLSKHQILESVFTMQSALDSFNLDDVSDLTAYQSDEIDME